MHVINIALGPGKKIIDANNFMPLFKELVDQMGADEASASGDEDAFSTVIKPDQISFPSNIRDDYVEMAFLTDTTPNGLKIPGLAHRIENPGMVKSSGPVEATLLLAG